jgi:hypothetical protein
MNHLNLNQSALNMVAFWEDPQNIPFKGKPISDDGLMSAQGQTLHLEGGYTVEQLQKMSQFDADRYTARILGISVVHSELLKYVNGKFPGAPQDVLTNPEKYLGPNYQEVLRFWAHLDTLSFEQLNNAHNRYWDLDSEDRYKSWDLAICACLCTIGWDKTKVVYDASGLYEEATGELIGYHELMERGIPLTFVPLFGFDPFDKNSLSENA